MMTACVLFIGCPSEEKPPPVVPELPHDYAPFLNEEEGRLNAEVISLGNELEESEAEIRRLEGELQAVEDTVAVEEEETQLKQLAQEDRSSSVITVEATHYTAYCEGCSGITYSGHDLRQSIYDAEGRRIVAVDPNVIPLGSVLSVSYTDGTTFDAIASDIGGDIKGMRIDIAVESKEEAYRLGRQAVSVTVLK